MTSAELGASPGGLSGVLKRGVGYSAAGVVICQLVIVIQTIVLGRLLGPEEVGVFTAGSVLLGGLLMVTHGTLAQALIHRDGDIEDAANTVLVATAATGVLLALGVLAASPVVGLVFHSSRVAEITAVTSGLVFLYLCVSVPQALMQRAFQFKQRVIIDPASKTAFAVVSIVFALLGYGAWSLVIGSYASIITELVLSWWLAKWRPAPRRFSYRLWRELAAFSLPLMLQGLADSIRDTFQQVLVGRALGTSDLGQYRYGYRLAFMPAQANAEICGYVLFPAFARVAGDVGRFRDAFMRALGWTWFAALPIGALLVVVGEPAAVLLLGEQWRPAGIAAMAMAGMGVGAALNSLGVQAIKGAGRPKLVNWITVLGLVLNVGLILVLLPFGLVGVGVALSVTYLIVGGVSVLIAGSVARVSLREMMACVGPSTISTLTAFAVVILLERVVIRSDRFAEPVGLASIAADCLIFGVIYVGVLRLISPSRYRSVVGFAERAVSGLGGRVRRAR